MQAFQNSSVQSPKPAKPYSGFNIKTTKSSDSPNGLQRPEQFWNNCNIVHLSDLLYPIQAY